MLNKNPQARGLVLNAKEGNSIEHNTRVLDTGDEALVKKIIRQISIGDFAHLPPVRDIKALFSNPQYQKLLHNTYHTLHLNHLSIDEVTAQVLSVILLSRNCRCRNLQLQRCSFTDAGRKIFFSALSMMAEHTFAEASDADCLDTWRQMTMHSMRVDSHALVGCTEREDMAPLGLYSLGLCQMGITDKKCTWLCSVLETQPYLRSLSLRDNPIEQAGIRRLLSALSRGCRDLKVLDLSGNLLRSQGASALAQYLLGSGKTIVMLDTSSNGITFDGARDLANVLRPESNSSLQSLNLDMNQLEGSGCELIGQALVQNQTLQVLGLSQNNLFDNGCHSLFAYLNENTALQSLNISGNFITHVGARAIQSYLQNTDKRASLDGVHRGLRTLDISTNSLGDEGIEAICAGLESNCHLLDLIANNVEVTDGGMPSIRKVLEAGAVNMPSLLILSLRHNHRLTRTGYEELAKGSRHNRHILRIVADLHFAGWDEVWSKVELALIRNTIYAVEKYRVPLLIVARGRILLHGHTHQCQSGSDWTARLPLEIIQMILSALDKYGVLSREQQIRALNIASNPTKRCSSKSELLAAVLDSDYLFAMEMLNTVYS
ncbi:RNA-DNA hybrid ribonuclease [Coemansia sp. RSA 2336]|nr:RNA-DNA hybrid ribonuclease [Coemansia sp. RSA 2336]